MASAAATNQKLMQQMVKLDGEFKGLRAQFTEFKKQRLEGGGLTPKSQPDLFPDHRPELDELAQRLSQERQERLSMQQGLQAGLLTSQSAQSALKEELRRLPEEMKKQNHELKHELKQLRHHLHDMERELRKHKAEVEDTRQTRDFPHHKLQAVHHDLHTFKQRIFDSGVLAPKIEKPPPEEPYIIENLELGPDVFSARMLLRLGLSKANMMSKDSARSVRKAESSSLVSDDDMAMVKVEDSDSAESVDSHSYSNELLAGLPAIENRPGERGYRSLTIGFLTVCIFTNLLQLAAVGNIIAFAILHGDACLDKPLSELDWWNLHISKFFGMLVVGCFMSGDVMDTVNFLMVEILLEPAPSLEVYMFVAFRVMFIFLVTVANGLNFIIATSPDGVWLYITAVEFVNALSRAVIPIARSGVMGHAISKHITDMNFTLCFSSEYPWWFGPARLIGHLLLFGVIGAFACYASFIPIQLCPADGTEPHNLFLPGT